MSGLSPRGKRRALPAASTFGDRSRLWLLRLHPLASKAGRRAATASLPTAARFGDTFPDSPLRGRVVRFATFPSGQRAVGLETRVKDQRPSALPESSLRGRWEGQ